MKYDPSYNGAIKEVSTDPFSVLFWSKEQQFYYSQIQNPCISVDATGGLISTSGLLSDIKTELKVDVRLPHIFLHLISVKNRDGNSVPVGQMLSAQQDSVKISYFFKRWLSDFSMPVEVVTDDSAAYHKSASDSFAKCYDIKEYITKCFSALNGECSDFKGPLLRLDSAHLIRNMHKNVNSKRLNHKAKHLYLSALGFIMQCEDFNAVCGMIEHIVVISNIPFDMKANNFSPIESVDKLTKLVRSHEIQIIFENIEDEDKEDAEDLAWNDFIDNEVSESDDDIEKNTFFDSILMKITTGLKIINQSECGVYYKPEMNPYFKKLFNRLPLWSAIMRKYSKTPNILAISNDTESRFNVIKNVVFNKLPTKPHTFVDILLTEVNALSKLQVLEIAHKKNCVKFVIINLHLIFYNWSNT